MPGVLFSNQLIMLGQKKTKIYRTLPRFSAPPLKCAERNSGAFSKSTLGHAGSGNDFFHGHVRNIPDLGKSPFFSVQIYAPVGIIRDAKGDVG